MSTSLTPNNLNSLISSNTQFILNFTWLSQKCILYIRFVLIRIEARAAHIIWLTWSLKFLLICNNPAIFYGIYLTNWVVCPINNHLEFGLLASSFLHNFYCLVVRFRGLIRSESGLNFLARKLRWDGTRSVAS